MKIAVVTPSSETPRPWLDQCLASVARQTIPCVHFLISDGDKLLHESSFPGIQFLRLPEPHVDYGNAARAIGSVSAIARDFDAIAYLDADNWFEPDHLQRLLQLHEETGAAVCTSTRMLHNLEGQLLGRCPEIDGQKFVDTSCLFLTRKAFDMVPVWYRMPRALAPIGDRVIWKAILDAKLSRAHSPVPTVHFRTSYRLHYEYFGKTPPAGAKHVAVSATASGQLKCAQVLTSETETAPPPVVASPGSPRAKVSLCMIVKNEEENLAECLTPVASLFHEVIVVDTGSTDRTKEIAARCGAKVCDFTWIDSFAAARNESLRHATGDWIFWLDADDRFDDDHLRRLERLIRNLPADNNAYMMRQFSLPDQLTGSTLVVDHVRLFRRQPNVCWRYRVHEQILLPLKEAGAKLVWTDITIKHLGYQDPSLRRQKIARNLRLLQLDFADSPNEAFTLFNLAGSYLDLGDVEQAIPHLRRCLELAPAGVTFLPKTFVLLTRAFHFLGRIDEALQHCREGSKRFPAEPELQFEEGSLLQARGDLAGARQCYEKILNMRPQGTFVGVDADLYGCRTRHNLALVYRGLSLPRQAEEQWLAAIEQAPDHGPVWLGLLELYLETQRPKDIDTLLVRLDQGPCRDQISPVLEARLALSRKDLPRARRIMEDAILRFPNNLWLRSLLSEILLRVGNDPQAAEMHLRAVLEKDPYQKQARQKLDQLLAKQRK